MSTVQPFKRAARLRSWSFSSSPSLASSAFWPLVVCCAFAVGCDLSPADSIALGPLPTRPVHIAPDDDAGFALPEGARPCRTDADCTDNIECSIDECLPAGYCSNRLDGAMCSDGLVCNGVETCHPTLGCIDAPPPTCDDKDPCTIDRCDEETKSCQHGIRDFDHDGEADFHCGEGTDCDDFDGKRGSLAAELCGDGIDNDCDQQIDEASCGAVPHDRCEDALDVSEGGVFNVSTVGATADYVQSCSEQSASRDVAFRFRLEEPRDVKLVASGLRPDGIDEVAVIALQTTCGSVGSELQCAEGFPGDLRVRALPAGEYYVVVSAAIGASSVLLKVTYSEATPAPTNMACEQAIDVGKGGHFDGNFVDVSDTVDTGCGFPMQPDLFYKVVLTEESDLEVSAIGSETQLVTVALHRGCGIDALEERCQSEQRILSYYHQLPPGEYVLVIEGPVSREIDFGLDVAVLPPTPPPTGDSCVDPVSVTFGETQEVTLRGMQDDIKSGCQSRGAADVVMSFTLDQSQDLNVFVMGDDTAQVTMALQTECGNELEERICTQGMPVDSVIHAQPPGQYFLVLDSYSASSVEVKVELAPPTAVTAVDNNDTCYSAWEIPEAGGLFSGDTSLLLQDYLVGCGATTSNCTCGQVAHFANDAAYALTLSSPKRVIARVEATFDAVLLRYRVPESGQMLCTGDAAACDDDSNKQHLPLLDESLPAGTYYYIVSGYDQSASGNYYLDVSVSDT